MEINAATYAKLPELKALKKEGKAWLLASFHPVYHAKAYVNPKHRYLLQISGVFDNKAGHFVRINTEKDLEIVKGLLADRDPWIRDAAQRALAGLTSQQGPLENEPVILSKISQWRHHLKRQNYLSLKLY